MKKIVIIFAIFITFCIKVNAQKADSTSTLKFIGVQEMGFMAFKTTLPQTLINPIKVNASIGKIIVSDTAFYYDTKTGEIYINGDLYLAYLKKSGKKYKLPLYPEDLDFFGKKAKWWFVK